jgi:hypothetical protein
LSYTHPIDTSAFDFDQWIRFAFDRPVSDHPWYYTEDAHFVCDPQNVITFYTRLFREPCPVLSHYDDARIEQGLWFAVGGQLRDWLWDNHLPLHLRLECVDAMPTMFRDFFLEHPLDTACFMWWDMLRTFSDSPERSVVEQMIAALDQILRLPVRHCQMSALHGLGHLRHESKDGVVRAFLSTHPHIDDEMREYAAGAIAGTVL